MKRKVGKSAAFLIAVLGGGTVMGTCEVRTHDAIIDGTKYFFLSLFDASNLTFLTETGDDTAE